MSKIKEDTMVNPKFESRCEICRWYLGDRKCPAFDGKIPTEVWKNGHDKVVEGQDDELPITFEQKAEIL